MTLNDISTLRLSNQKIAATEFKSVKEIVGWMGAIQAQDFTMAKWAIGLRITDSTDEDVEKAFNKGDILRTHLMRPTWHLISSEDIYWMLELTAPQIRSTLKSRNKVLELNESILNKSKRVIEEALESGLCLTRDELAIKINEAGIRTDENRLSHLFMEAELEGLVCSGPVKMKKQTYCLLRERVPYKKVFPRDESLAELAKKYLDSHGPATLSDFVWWSGLRVKDAIKAFESVKSGYVTEIIGSEKYLFSNSIGNLLLSKHSMHLLPSYDEFLISYKDRSASLYITYNKKAISNNGIFYPVILSDGKVTGTWRRSAKKGELNIELIPFEQMNDSDINLIEQQAKRLAQFLKLELKIRYGKYQATNI